MAASGERWWPTRPAPKDTPTEVTMDAKRRETVGPTKVALAFHDATLAVVCQEGCYPDKKVHVNQDCFVVDSKFVQGDANQGQPHEMLLGVFDGHGPNGEHCASIAANSFPQILRDLRSDDKLRSHGARDAKVPHREWNADEALQSYSVAFVDTDAKVMGSLGSGAKSSGTTALVAHIIGDMLHMGNVGDSRALLGVEMREDEGRNSAPASPPTSPTRRGGRISIDGLPRWEVLEVSHDQTCFRNDERERMKKEATEPVMFATLGMILGETPMSEDFGEETIEAADDPPRVFRAGNTYPGCAFTRSLGDTTGKTLGVCARPELLTFQLDSSARCLILASDGVFEFMTNEEVLAIARSRKKDGPLTAAQEIVKTAFAHWANEDSRSDDVTCAVVYFDPKKGAVERRDSGGEQGLDVSRKYALQKKDGLVSEIGLPSTSKASENWKKIRDVLRAGAIRNRPATRFANAVLAAAAMDLRRRRGSLAMEELFPGFDFQSVGELRRMGSLKGGLKAVPELLASLSLQDKEEEGK